jgi:hypothetical protein
MCRPFPLLLPLLRWRGGEAAAASCIIIITHTQTTTTDNNLHIIHTHTHTQAHHLKDVGHKGSKQGQGLRLLFLLGRGGAAPWVGR